MLAAEELQQLVVAAEQHIKVLQCQSHLAVHMPSEQLENDEAYSNGTHSVQHGADQSAHSCAVNPTVATLSHECARLKQDIARATALLEVRFLVSAVVVLAHPIRPNVLV